MALFKTRGRWLAALSGVGAITIVVSLFFGTAQAGSRKPSTTGKVYNIYLSNGHFDDWRIEMENLAQVLAQKPPLGGHIKLTIVNTAENTPTDQIQSLNNIIASKPDAILIDASSSEALNATIQRACSAKIVVVSFDQVVTAPCAWKVNIDNLASATRGAQWIANTLKGQGNVFVDLGIPGYPISNDYINGYTSVFQKYPGIKMACKFTSEAAEAQEQSGVANCLAANPNVSAIYTLGPGTGAMAALKAAGHAPVPVFAEAYNATLQACAKSGQPCWLTADPAWMGGLAEKIALQVLEKQRPNHPTTVIVPSPSYESNNVAVAGTSPAPQQIVLGKNAFPSLPDGIVPPFSPPWTTVSAREEATGKCITGCVG